MKADVNAANSKGLSPLDLANKASSWAMYKVIEDAGGALMTTAAQNLSVPKNWGGKGNDNCIRRSAGQCMSVSWVALEYLWS